MFFEYLSKMREKPRHVRRTIALGATVVLFLGVVAMWISTNQAQSAVTNNNASVSAVGSFFSVIKDIFSQATEAIHGNHADTGSSATSTPQPVAPIVTSPTPTSTNTPAIGSTTATAQTF